MDIEAAGFDPEAWGRLGRLGGSFPELGLEAFFDGVVAALRREANFAVFPDEGADRLQLVSLGRFADGFDDGMAERFAGLAEGGVGVGRFPIILVISFQSFDQRFVPMGGHACSTFPDSP